MKLALNTLPFGRSEQVFDSIAPLQQDASVEWTPHEFALHLRIDRQASNYYVHGDVSVTGTFICDAGMEPFKDSLTGDFDVILTHDPTFLDGAEEDEVVHIPAHEVDFDLYPLVRETLLLAIPISHVCGPDCEHAQALQARLEPPDEPDERWAKLKDLFKE